MLSIFLYVCWTCVCLLQRNVCLGLPPIFWLHCLFFFILSYMNYFYTLEINFCQLLHLQIFSPILRESSGLLIMLCFLIWVLFHDCVHSIKIYSLTIYGLLYVCVYVNSWRRKWQPTPLFLPGESPWTEELGRSMKSESQTRVRKWAQHMLNLS